MFQPQRMFPGFSAVEVELARKRVERCAMFFNLHFPGWQYRIHEIGSLLYMESFDYCPAAIAARGRVPPPGRYRSSNYFTHGDLCREFRDFQSVEMGCTSDDKISCKLLELMWKEAALWIPPLPVPPPRENFFSRVLNFVGR